MKKHSYTVWQMTDNIGEYILLEDVSVEYDGPIAKCDRAAQADANNNIKQSNSVAGQAGQNAAQDRSLIYPTIKNEINNPTGYTAGAQNKMLTSAEAGAGGATSGLTGSANLLAARTRNSSGTSGLLDSLARAKDKSAAGASEGIAADSAKLAEMKKQSALTGGQSLMGTDLGTQLKGIDASTDATNAYVNAGKSGWFQNMVAEQQALGDDAKGAAALGAHV